MVNLFSLTLIYQGNTCFQHCRMLFSEKTSLIKGAHGGKCFKFNPTRAGGSNEPPPPPCYKICNKLLIICSFALKFYDFS